MQMTLDADKILATVDTLARRINERFPDADLSLLARNFTRAARTMRRDVIAGRSFLSGTPPEVHFGLGAATQVDTLRVKWADGTETTLQNVAADQWLRLTAP